MKRLGIVAGILVVALVGSLLVRVAIVGSEEPVVVVHWANSHPMRPRLLPAMAEEFNDEDHETADGRPIEIQVISCDSSDQAADLVERIGGPATDAQCLDESDETAPDPTIITPQSDDWFVDVNADAKREVIHPERAPSIAETWLGIVTYRAMAECMGWPEADVGYAEMIDVLENGWAAYPDCAPRADWGDPPRLVFTNPNTSTSGRNVLVSLYARAAGVAPDELTPTLVEDPEVSAKVEEFQKLIDHYMPSTASVNTRIAQGPRYGAFFLMPEDNLANLILGNEKMVGPDGAEATATAPDEPLVMIYPHEGAVLNSNPAGLVDAPWVADEQAEAATQWTEYLLSPDQQQLFMDAGFRPPESTGLEVDEGDFAGWGLDPEPPESTIEPGGITPEALQAILDSWGTVKKPAIVTFVVDVSGSMGDGPDPKPIEQVKDGLVRLLNAMSGPDSAGHDSRVGLVTFGGAAEGAPDIDVVVRPDRLADIDDIGAEVDGMEPHGGTPLYDAVREAVAITTAAEGEEGATRAVVVLSDGKDTISKDCLEDIVAMQAGEASVQYCGQVDPGTEEPTDVPVHASGDEVSIDDVSGAGPLLSSDVQVFFLGFSDADISVGRILAEATGGEYVKGEGDLATVIEELSGYF